MMIRKNLCENTEYRFEVDENEATVKVTSGNCEIYGYELLPKKPYILSLGNYSIYSVNGCTIEIEMENIMNDYVSEETNMGEYMKIHCYLEKLRMAAAETGSVGPKVLILGTGRATLSKILCNYLIRSSRIGLWVDLDVENGPLLFPSTISANIYEGLIDPVSEGKLTTPISYFFGYQQITSKLTKEIYMKLLEVSGESILSQLRANEKLRSLGAIITGSRYNESEYSSETLLNTISNYEIDMVLVVGEEKTYYQIEKALQKVQIRPNLFKVPRIEGHLIRSPNYRKKILRKKIHWYFYGSINEYLPLTVTVPIYQMHIRKFSEGLIVPESALPIGSEKRDYKIHIQKVKVKDPNDDVELEDCIYLSSGQLIGSILGVSHAPLNLDGDISMDVILGAPMKCYIMIKSIDLSKKLMTIMAPFPEDFNDKYLILGGMKASES